MLVSGAVGPGFKSQPRRCRCNILRQTVHTHCASVHQAAKLVAALLRVAGVTAVLAESNGSLPPGLWLTSPAGWLPRTGISSGTIRSVLEYGRPFISVCMLWLIEGDSMSGSSSSASQSGSWRWQQSWRTDGLTAIDTAGDTLDAPIGNESVPKIIINDAINLVFKLQSAFS